MFKLIIAGGRDFDNYEALKEICDKLLVNQKDIQIVSGTAKGADALGEKYAIERRYSLKSFPAPWTDTEGKPKSQVKTKANGSKYWTKAGNYRNAEMAKYADALIAFWDGKSSGTKDMIETAKKNNLLVKVRTYENRVNR